MLATAMTEQAFGRVFVKLALQLRWHDADVAVIKGYYDVLGEFNQESVAAAADQFARESGRKFPPTSAEWFTLAREFQATTERTRLALPAGRDEPWKHECLSCEDTGWVMHLACDGGANAWPEEQPLYRAEPRETVTPQPSRCGRKKPHQPHEYTRVCECRPTNRTYQRKQRALGGL